VQHKDAKVRLLTLAAQLLHRGLDVLLQLSHRVLERCPRVVHLVNDEHVLADQVGHLEGRQIEPLCAGDFCAGLLDFGVSAELLVEGEADGLDGDVGRVALLEEGSGVGELVLEAKEKM
jgi:hypothetical protein